MGKGDDRRNTHTRTEEWLSSAQVLIGRGRFVRNSFSGGALTGSKVIFKSNSDPNSLFRMS